MVNEKTLLSKLEELEMQEKQVIAQLNAIMGAKQCLQSLIEDKPKENK